MHPGCLACRFSSLHPVKIPCRGVVPLNQLMFVRHVTDEGAVSVLNMSTWVPSNCPLSACKGVFSITQMDRFAFGKRLGHPLPPPPPTPNCRSFKYTYLGIKSGNKHRAFYICTGFRSWYNSAFPPFIPRAVMLGREKRNFPCELCCLSGRPFTFLVWSK